MKKVSIVLALLLVIVIGCSVFACQPNNNSNTNNNNDDNTQNNQNSDGFITGTATIEDVSDELVMTLLSTANTASTNRLSSTNPCVSWQIDLAMVINDRAYDVRFEINYDNRDKSKTEMRIVLFRHGESKEFLSAFYFQDEPNGNKTPGSMYLQYGDAKVKVPLVDTFLGSLFPISFGTAESSDGLATLVSGFVSANLFTKGDIAYKYKDESDGKRTRNYVLQLDLKKTLMNVVNLMGNTSSFADVYDSVLWIIESIFGVDSNKINSQLPDTTITLDITTKGGSRTTLGKGSIDSCKVHITAAASDYKESIFRGESYDIEMNLLNFKAANKLIADFPKEDSGLFDDYVCYDSTAIVVNGSLMFNGNEDTLYDMQIGIRYDGLSEEQDQDEFMVKVTDKSNPELIYVEFYAFDNKAYLNYLTDDNVWLELEFAFDVDAFIEQMIIIGGDTTTSMGFLKIVAYVLGSFHIWEDGSLSLNIDGELVKGVLNTDVESLVQAMQYAYSYAGGTGVICADQLTAQLGKDTTMADIISTMIIEREILIILDRGDDTLNTTDDLIDESKFA
ncbi:MAG: hypothetical protein IJ033_05560 [Clostridia bacterium]|nr:hypothetical protein [Clostridia bacterium]